jgi:hypothetical protein
VLSGLVVVATAGRAAASPPGADPSATEAQSRFEEGLARVKAGDFAAARVSFAQAYAVLKRPRILWNLALAEEKTGLVVDALTHFKQVLHDPATSEGDRANAQAHADALGRQTGHVDVQAPPGVSVTVDGSPQAAVTPLVEPLDVAPGHHVIEAKLAQGTKTLSVDALAGQVAHVSFVATDAVVAELPPAGPNVAPPSAPPVAAETMPAIAPVETHSPSIARNVTTSVVAGVAVAAIVFGVYFAEKSISDADTANGYRGAHPSSWCSSSAGDAATCGQWNDAVKAQNREATASNAFYIAGGVLAAGAIATWFLWPKSSERSGAALWVRPELAPTMAGLGAGGSF